MMRRLLTSVLVVGLVLTGCGRGEQTESDRAQRVIGSPGPGEPPSEPAEGSPSPSPASRSSGRVSVPTTPAPAAPGLADARVGLTQIANLSAPLALAVRAGDDALYVVEKEGRVRAIRGGQVDGGSVLDISSEVSTGGEQGLLGLAFSPDGGYLYVNFTDRDGDTVVREYRFAGGRADAGTARQVLKFDQPASNHNGGDLMFGPDRRMYITTGDGGGAGDPDGNAQNLNSLLGKILRIDPRPSGSQPYGIPQDNPFVGRSGARGEIWAYGLRNPWRMSFDRANGDWYIGDVGQGAIEEVDWRPASSKGGENFGWNRLEGSRPFRGSPPPDHVLPIYEYERTDGNCSVTGGYVYRGQRIPALVGAYVFADYCKGALRAFVQSGGRAADHRLLGPTTQQLSSFGQDAAGEIYVLSLRGPVYRIDPV